MTFRLLRSTFSLLFTLVLAACAAPNSVSQSTAQPAVPTTTAAPAAETLILVPTPTRTPQPIPNTVSELPGAILPPGFSITVYASGIYRPTALAFGPDGTLYVASVDASVYAVLDTQPGGTADTVITFASNYPLPLGLAVDPNTNEVYISHTGQVVVLTDSDGDHQADDKGALVTGLPNGLHQNDDLEIGPDGALYLGLGSTCDACREPDPRSASILRIDPVTKEATVYATGLRNPFDVAFHPLTGDLFATDNGRDDLGLDDPSEELNLIVQGGDYGWPGCWNQLEGPDCAGTLPALVFFDAHSSVNNLLFYTADSFPSEYENMLFLTVFGSFLKPEVQTGIRQVNLIPSGDTYTAESGWFAQFPAGIMPLGFALGPDGALYFGSYLTDTVYRISYGIP